MTPAKAHCLTTATMPSSFGGGWHFHNKRTAWKRQAPPSFMNMFSLCSWLWLWQEFCSALWCSAASHAAKLSSSKCCPFGHAGSYFIYDHLCPPICVWWVGVHEWHVELHILKMSFDRFAMLLSFIQFFTPTPSTAVSAIPRHSCRRHVCCHALRIPLSTWVRKST